MELSSLAMDVQSKTKPGEVWRTEAVQRPGEWPLSWKSPRISLQSCLVKRLGGEWTCDLVSTLHFHVHSFCSSLRLSSLSQKFLIFFFLLCVLAYLSDLLSSCMFLFSIQILTSFLFREDLSVFPLGQVWYYFILLLSAFLRNSFSFSTLNNNLAGQNILGCRFFPLRTLNMSFLQHFCREVS